MKKGCLVQVLKNVIPVVICHLFMFYKLYIYIDEFNFERSSEFPQEWGIMGIACQDCHCRIPRISPDSRID
jgi:hypothetical protein